jgi:hypothetical protein
MLKRWLRSGERLGTGAFAECAESCVSDLAKRWGYPRSTGRRWIA